MAVELILLLTLLVVVANGDGTRLDSGGDDVSACVMHVSVELGC